MADKDIEELVEEAKKPGTFNIVEVLKGRSYPTETVNVYLDEATAYRAAKLNEELKETAPESKEYKEIQEQLDSVVEELRDGKYVFELMGISEGEREKLHATCVKKYPIEYSEEKNILMPESKKTEIPNQERDDMFTNMLWAAHIKKIVSPNGDMQESISVSDAEVVRSSLPFASSIAINESIEKLRAATAVFLYSVDEDFLAKS